MYIVIYIFIYLYLYIYTRVYVLHKHFFCLDGCVHKEMMNHAMVILVMVEEGRKTCQLMNGKLYFLFENYIL